MKRFTARVYPVADVQRGLTNAYEKVEDAPAVNITLHEQQKTVIAAMLDLESTHKFTLADGNVVVSSSGVLSEPFGSGKTIIILNVIARSKVPRALPQAYGCMVDSPLMVSKKMLASDALITATAIVVGKPVFEQWKTVIKSITRLSYFGVHDYHSMLKFISMVRENRINTYDIILIRQGAIVGKFPEFGDTTSNKSRQIVQIVQDLLPSRCWARAIYDDYDTIKIPQNVRVFNALFSWFVSASKRSPPEGKSPSCETLVETLDGSNPPIISAASDPILNGIFNIRATNRYRDRSTRVPYINFHNCVYNNPDDVYMHLLQGIGDAETKEMIEMLNGDAIRTAAATLNIAATSIADIFQKILGNKHEAYTAAKKLMDHLLKWKEELEYIEEDPDGRSYPQQKLEKAMSRLRKLKDPKFEFAADNIDYAIDELIEKTRFVLDENGNAIERMINNIKTRGCGVCKLPLTNQTMFILKCCGLVVHTGPCLTKGCQFHRQYSRHVKGMTLCGRCANCTAIIDKAKMIFLDRNFNIDSIINAAGDEETKDTTATEPVEEEDPAEAAPEDADAVSKIKNPKIRAIINILLGNKVENDERVAKTIPMLMPGNVDLPAGPDTQRKVLIFANQDETLANVAVELAKRKMPYLQLGGTSREMAQMLADFKTGPAVAMLINSNVRCAGMNIEFATDIVFTHKILDQNIEGQVAGRAQRFGRTCNLNIYFLLYENEVFYT